MSAAIRLATTFMFLLCVGGAALAQASLADSYAEEQAEVAALRSANTIEGQRQLAAMLTEGLIASPQNPLRRTDRAGAATAYRHALELGDQSAATVVALARLLLREDDSAGLAELMPLLQNFTLQGNGDAAYILALDASQNRLQPIETVRPMLESAAVMGSVSAVLDLAEGGVAVGGVVRAQAVERLQQRALSGWAPAATALAQLYDKGRLVERDPATAMKWLQTAVDGGHLAAFVSLAEHFQYGIDVAADPARAADLYRQGAEAGSSVAALALGRDANPGSIMGIGIEEGRLWLRRAAEIGVRGAAIEIATLDLASALALDASRSDKAQLIEQALAPIAMDPDALASLADRHWRTTNSALIGPVLLPMLERATLTGSATAGLAYEAWLRANGQILPDDAARALITALRKSPPTSLGFATFTIANLALDNRISQDVVSKNQAVDLLFQAADVKVGQAMLRVAQMYARGEVFAKSHVFAVRWYTMAQAQAVERASWDLAALDMASDDPASQAQATRFYLQRMDEGDARGAVALVRHRLRNGTLDPSTLAQAKAVASDPRDALALALALAGTGLSERITQAKEILLPLIDERPNPDAMVAYGRLLITSGGSSEDTMRGLELLRRAAGFGTVSAKIALAQTYLSSVVYTRSRPEALQLLNQVLEENPRDPDAQLLMSRIHLMGLGVERDPIRAQELVSEIRARGEFDNPKATMLEADWLAFSQSRRDPQAAMAMLSAQANRGSAAAERALGETYLSGFGSRLDPDTAAGHLFNAAKAGDKDAMAAFGHLLVNGHGISQIADTGIIWLARAADAGSTAAMYELSRIYALGSVGRIDEAQSLAWLRRAADRNHPNAAYQLGLSYLKGEFVERDVAEAAKWFERSAKAGSLVAGRTLETLRNEGTGSSEAAPTTR